MLKKNEKHHSFGVPRRQHAPSRNVSNFNRENVTPDTAIPMLQYLADKGAKMDVPNTKGDIVFVYPTIDVIATWHLD